MSENIDFKVWVTTNYIYKNKSVRGLVVHALHPKGLQKEVNGIYKNKKEAIQGALENKYVQETGKFSIGNIDVRPRFFTVTFPENKIYFIGNVLKKEEVYKITENPTYHNQLDNAETTMFVITDSNIIHPLDDKRDIVLDKDANQIWPVVKPSLFSRLGKKIKEITK